MSISTAVSPDFMVRKVLLNGEENMAVTNVRLISHPLSAGVFENKSKYYLMKKGILLSTGRAEDALGPNDEPNTSFAMSMPGNPALDRIATGRTYDATMLSFEFSPLQDSIYFNFVFASEEYPEYVHKGVNDIFAFFLTDLENGEMRNLAVFGEKGLPVNVDNINMLRNPELYIENAVWDPEDIYQWADNPGVGELALNYQFDGFTVPMSAGARVIPYRRYRIAFAIADVGDNLFDSAVFLESGSFTSVKGEHSERQNNIAQKLRKALTDQSVEMVKENGEVKIRLYVQFEFDNDQIVSDSDKEQLNEIVRMMRIQPDIKLRIEGHTDNVGSEDYNEDLSGRRAFSVASYLMDHGLDEDRLSAMGYGATKPLTENVTREGRNRNRRVELVFY